MTCVLASPWSSFGNALPWSSMNVNESTAGGLERAQSHGYASSGSEARKSSIGGPSAKKRASRAGTRSVSTLSAAQLERKRANDREAQRAIRQRTKDHIESLERSINDLRQTNDASEKLVAATRHRNRELEEENSYLRLRLNEAGVAVNLPPPPPPSEGRQHDPNVLQHSSPAAHVSGLNIRRPSSATNAPSHASGSRHGSWQHPSGYAPVPNPQLVVPGGPVGPPSNMTAWRPHEGAQSMQVPPAELQTPQHAQHNIQYASTSPADRSQWTSTTPQYYHHGLPEQPAPPQYPQQHPQSTVQQPQAQAPYAQPPMPSYANAPPPPQAAYHPPQLPPQSEFQNMSVTSPVNYHIPQPTHGYAPPAQYQMTPLQVQPPPADYQGPHAQMHPSPMSATSYASASTEQAYAQPPMQYREDPNARGYTMSHYPSG